MTASGTWTDPKSGGSYSTGELLPHGDLNDVIDGQRVIDSTLARMAAGNYTNLSLISIYPTAVAYDSSTGIYAIVGNFAGAGAITYIGILETYLTATFSSTNLLEITSVASDNAGTFVAGGNPSSSIADKILQSTDGGANWTRRSLTTADSSTVQNIVFFDGKFYAFASSAGPDTGYVESSSDGITWARESISYDIGAWSPKASSSIVANDSLLVAMSTKGVIYTEGGGIWGELELSQSDWWTKLAWTPRWGWKAYSTNASAYSSNGKDWHVNGLETLPSGSVSIVSLAAVGNVYICSVYGISSDCYLLMSTDGCRTWEPLTSSFSFSNGRYIHEANNRIAWLGFLSSLPLSDRII